MELDLYSQLIATEWLNRLLLSFWYTSSGVVAEVNPSFKNPNRARNSPVLLDSLEKFVFFDKPVEGLTRSGECS